MRALKTLDVTLRDGGHRVGFNFDKHHITTIIQGLDDAGIDIIEVGYRNGMLSQNESFGQSAYCNKEYLLFCNSLIKQAKMAVMIYPENVSNSDLEELFECGVS